jgi:hypothetical protein
MSHMAHFGHDDYTLNVPHGVLRLLKVKKFSIESKHGNILSKEPSYNDSI